MLYLDAAASTAPHPEVLALLHQHYQQPHANPSSVHPWGLEQRKLLQAARMSLGQLFSLPAEGVTFVASGTESDNLAIKGVLFRAGKPRGRFLTTHLEHKAVSEAAAWYQSIGGSVDWVEIEPATGQVDLADLEAKLSAETTLVSIQHVNSETGLVQDLAEIGRVIRQKAPQAVFHSDGVQALGKIEPNLRKWSIDLYSISGHKVHGLLGAGALLRARNIPMEAQISGGGQESGLRSGTENLPAIRALAWAAQWAESNRAANQEAVENWADSFFKKLSDQVSGLHFVGGAQRVPHIRALYMDGALGEVLLHHLAAEGILASQGSACQARSKKLSPVLRALGLNDLQIRRTLRLSFSPLELKWSPAEAAKAFASAVQQVRQITS
ncbi:MAG: cysteine desulfurase family protein [bacterium]|nr:cysteine desulfurase family protein [bacterium]